MNKPLGCSTKIRSRYTDELENFIDVIQRIRPRSAAIRVGDIDIYGGSTFLNGAAGGDHIVYLDFDKRYDLDKRAEAALALGHQKVARRLLKNRDRVGVLLADVSGHRLTDALVAAMLHQAFLTGVLYELDQFGEVTTRLFENLNIRLFNSLSVEKYVTATYGEISAGGRFRFILAGSPEPLVFSAKYDRFITICSDRLAGFQPLGMFPSEDDVDISRNLGFLGYKRKYTVNEVNLMGVGDILLLCTDGLADHSRDEGDAYLPERLESTLRSLKHESAQTIFEGIHNDALAFAPPGDDLSFVVIKRG
jgi:serine phosphatase RsbU (regulator of sigma subunit)